MKYIVVAMILLSISAFLLLQGKDLSAIYFMLAGIFWLLFLQIEGAK